MFLGKYILLQFAIKINNLYRSIFGLLLADVENIAQLHSKYARYLKSYEQRTSHPIKNIAEGNTKTT